MDDFLENLTSLTNNLEDIAFSRYVKITKVNTDGTVDCKDEYETVHKNALNSTQLHLSVEDTVLLGFINNDIYNPIILGGVDVRRADEQMIYSLGLGLFTINDDGDLIYNLSIGVDNYFSIDDTTGNLLIDLDESEASKFSINDEGEIVYG